MHFSYWMVLVAALLPYITVGAAKSQKGYDNASPRPALDRLSGWRARADWAHRNHFEAFPAFAAGVIIAQMKGMPQHTIDVLSGVFILARLAYTGVYLANLASVRSLIWFVGLVCVICLFVLG
jgi:uncharacterized MAPEG superfamily protein